MELALIIIAFKGAIRNFVHNPTGDQRCDAIIIIVMIIIIIIELIIIVIAFKGTIRYFFYNLLTAPRTVSKKYAQVART